MSSHSLALATSPSSMLTENATGSGEKASSPEKTGEDNGNKTPIPIIMAAKLRLTDSFIEFPLHQFSQYSRTNPAGFRLLAAYLASVALHLLPAMPALMAQPPRPLPPSPMPSLNVALRPPPLPPLKLPEPPKEASSERTPPPAPNKQQRPPPPPAHKPAARTASWTEQIRQHIRKLDQAGQFYPAEAIQRGIQGDVDVLMVLDEAGKVVAARVEHGSGHAILDEAALRAIRSLTSVPADAPRQVVLPVRFRLKN